jgi:translation initiation factor 2 subunit 1
MSAGKPPLPEVGENTVATIKRVVPYGAYVALEEYGGVEGFVHISEISSSWVKNIRDHVREGQKTVLRVLRVDPVKLQIDLSLRRVSEREKREKLIQWKQDSRGRSLLSMASEKIKVNPDEAYQKVGTVLEDRFGSIYRALEQAAEEGTAPLIKAGIPEEWASILVEIAKAKIRVPKVKISGILEVSCNKPEGVEVIREAFKKAIDAKKTRSATVSIYTIGSPKYRIEVVADNFKNAERVLEASVQAVINAVTERGGEGKFTRKE